MPDAGMSERFLWNKGDLVLLKSINGIEIPEEEIQKADRAIREVIQQFKEMEECRN